MNANLKNINKLESITPEYFEVLEEGAQDIIDDFKHNSDVDLSRPVDILFSVDIDVGRNIAYSLKLNISQEHTVSEAVYHSEFYDRDGNSPEQRVVILLLMHIAKVLGDPSNIDINLILPNMSHNSNGDLAFEIKRTVEWYHCIQSCLKTITYRETMGIEGLDWRSVCVKLGDNKRVSLDQANVIVKSHLQNIIKPYVKLSESTIKDTLGNKTITPMEQALALRLMAIEERFLDKMRREDAFYLCRFLWCSDKAATYKSKIELFQKYLSKDILAFTQDKPISSTHDIDIFNVTQLLRHNCESITEWVQGTLLSDDNLSYMLNVYGNSGYTCENHYALSVKMLGIMYQNANTLWKKNINKHVLESSEIEEIYAWINASKQDLLGLGMECVEMRTIKFKAFGQGIILSHQLKDVCKKIKTTYQVRVVCMLFNISPADLLGHVEASSAKTREVIGEVIVSNI